jgi:phosphatidylserine/phosphatidylglycerophosphate/cardiolipin synthase-like enzyme
MGEAMVKRLTEAGHGVDVWNRTRSKAEPLAEYGATIVNNKLDLSACEVVFTMVSTTDDLKEVLFAEGGLVTGKTLPKMVVDSSSISQEGSAEVREALEKLGVAYVCAPVSGNAKVAKAGKLLVVASGPADPNERCTLLFLEAITRAKDRVWIASPYFVPDESILRALQVAALRGVDVRVLLPEKADHLMVWLASFSYVPEVTAVGVKVFRYTKGFLHQKVFLVDDYLSAVGTANLDNRSLRLNFEVTALVYDSSFCSRVGEMLTADFARSRDVSSMTFSELSLFKKLGSKAARLFSPVL